MIVRSYPQAWTSERTAVRALAALAITHPKEFSSALSSSAGHNFSGAISSSFRCEDKRTDLRFSTLDSQDVFIEAKIDDFVSVEQIDKYLTQFSTSKAVLLVPEVDAPDVLEVLRERPELIAVSWRDLLRNLSRTNPLAAQVETDIYALAALPGTKAKVRRALASALEAHPPKVSAKQTSTASRLPCIDLSVRGTWVFGQIESAREHVSKDPKFQAKVGFETSKEDARDERSKRKMREALHEAWGVAEGLESRGALRLSRNRHASRQQRLFGVEEPYQARGYMWSHAGPATDYSRDASEVLAWGSLMAERFAIISNQVWGTRD